MSLDCSLIFAQKRVNLTSKCEHGENVSVSNDLKKHLLKLIEYNASLWLNLEVMFDLNERQENVIFKNVSETIEFVYLSEIMQSLARKKWTLSVQNLNCQSKIQQWLKQKKRRVRIWDLHRSTDRRKLSWRSEFERRVICWDAQDVSQRLTWIQQHLKSAEFLKSSYTDTWVSEKKRYFTSYEQWSDRADWNSKFLFYRKIRFCISDLIRKVSWWCASSYFRNSSHVRRTRFTTISFNRILVKQQERFDEQDFMLYYTSTLSFY